MKTESNGTLTDSRGTETPVLYSFEMEREIAYRPGLPPAVGSVTGRGSITGIGGEHFANGVYRLRTVEGQEFRVQKLFTEWLILASLP